MQAARRIYVYLLSGISLAALVTGLTMLLGVLLNRLGLGPTGEAFFGGDESLRQQLTVATALTVVSLPVWLIHWFVAERSVRPNRPGGLRELNAPQRGLYFAIALTALLAVGALSVASVVQGAILRATGGGEFNDLAGDLARAAVTLAFWTYHIRVRGRDWRRHTLTHAAAYLPRAYRYGAALVGSSVMLFAITGLLELTGRVLLDAPTFDPGDGSPWWAFALAGGVSGVLVGGAIWIGHWVHAARLLADPGPRGASERDSRLRLAYFVAVIIAASAATLAFLGAGIGAGIQLLLGMAEPASDAEAVGSVLVPLLSAGVFATSWWLHSRWLDDEPIALASPDGAATADRLRLYPVALIGLAFGAVGTAWLIGLLIDTLFGAAVIGGDPLRGSELARFAPYAVLGWLVWAWRWMAIARRTAADPAGEAASTTRRAMSLIALAVSVLAGIGAAGAILYRLFGSLFGVDLTGDPVSELSLPIGVLLTAAAVGAGHAVLLRRDARALAGPKGDQEEAVAESRTVRLRLTGERDGIDAALAALGAATPSGYALELEGDEPPGA
jgi:hypothetical protein